MLIETIDDLLVLKENYEVEFKKASGIDGRGTLPSSFWETYSSFANTEGGSIFLGVEESNTGELKILGIKDPGKITRNIFDLANNKSKISSNLLDNNSVKHLVLDNKAIIQVIIPKASRKQRPVFIGTNPMGGSFTRRYDGDYKLGDDSVKKMLADQLEHSCDEAILRGYSIEEDLNSETITAYKNLFASLNPNHPFVNEATDGFLKAIGAWRIDRETGERGVTLAGLLMFGKLRSILDERSNYNIDYREYTNAPDEERWSDRITTDFNWSGNLYDFYRKSYNKIINDLKVPFKLKDGLRVDETPVHEALREALVNTIIHSDYSGSVSILIKKYPNMFSFRNPGLMRVSIERAIECGENDCRNKTLQKMFHLIKACDQAGSGLPKIYQNWKQQKWRVPSLKEFREPDQTIFELHMISLLPKMTIDDLEKLFGENFKELSELECVALATAAAEKSVNHRRLIEISDCHPSDISKALSRLTKNGFLVSKGEGRGTRYSLPESYLGGLSSDREGRLGGLEDRENDIARNAIKKKKLSRDKMEKIIIELCLLRPQTITNLGRILDRNQDFLRKTYIAPMVKTNKIEPLHKDPSHPMQSYTVAAELVNSLGGLERSLGGLSGDSSDSLGGLESRLGGLEGSLGGLSSDSSDSLGGLSGDSSDSLGGLEGSLGGLSGDNSDSLGGLESRLGSFDVMEAGIAKNALRKKKLPRDKMEQIIIELCSLRPQTITNLGRILNRNQDFLRRTYITSMVKTNKIMPLHKDPSHPMQSYTAI